MKKIISILLTVSMLAAVLAGCADKAPSTDSTEATPSADREATVAEQPAPEPSEVPVSVDVSAVESSDVEQEVIEYVSPFPLEEHESLSAWAMWIPGIEQYVDSPMDTLVAQEMEKRTNVTIEMTLASSPETAMTEINLLIASGDYPDLIRCV